MAEIKVVRPGVQVTVQDLGRPGLGAYGVPSGGAMDRFALAAANLLLGNAPGAAGLEVLLGGLDLRFGGDTSVCITGADLGATLDGRRLDLWTPAAVRAGATLSFIQRRAGARAYVALPGGIDVPAVLGSRSTYLPGAWGGLGGRSLQHGDRIKTPCDPLAPAHGWLAPEYRPPYSPFPVLRCVLGPHASCFSRLALLRFFCTTYRLSSHSDRMGLRLEGRPVHTSSSAGIPSTGVLPGVIQTPPNGSPILLMADAQTSGGYPIIAIVLGADLPLAAQLLPGDRLRFRLVGIGQAVDAAKQAAACLASMADRDEVIAVPV